MTIATTAARTSAPRGQAPLAGQKQERSRAATLADENQVPRTHTARIDPAGHTLAGLALLAITAALTQASVAGWTGTQTVGLGAAGALIAVGFALVERRTHEPMLPVDLFARRDFSAAVAVGALFNFALYGTLFCVALHLEKTNELSARATGLVLVPLTVAVGTGALLSGRLGARFGARIPMLAGLGGGALGALLLTTLAAGASPILVAVLGAILGVAGLAMPAMTSVVLGASPPDRAGLGSAVLNASRQTGGALGVALLGSLAGSAGASLTAPMAAVAAAYLAAVAATATAIRA